MHDTAMIYYGYDVLRLLHMARGYRTPSMYA